MAYVKEKDIVLVDEMNFEKFMEYRKNKGLTTSYGWMHLPAGAMLEVVELIFRTTGGYRIKKKKSDEEENTVRRRGRSCWVKCSVVTPIDRTGEEHIIPSWILSKHVLSQITA